MSTNRIQPCSAKRLPAGRFLGDCDPVPGQTKVGMEQLFKIRMFLEKNVSLTCDDSAPAPLPQ
jgi:hypothetical protein